eukprot:6472491-Amphidinium_carterae.1
MRRVHVWQPDSRLSSSSGSPKCAHEVPTRLAKVTIVAALSLLWDCKYLQQNQQECFNEGDPVLEPV